MKRILRSAGQAASAATPSTAVELYASIVRLNYDTKECSSAPSSRYSGSADDGGGPGFVSPSSPLPVARSTDMPSVLPSSVGGRSVGRSVGQSACSNSPDMLRTHARSRLFRVYFCASSLPYPSPPLPSIPTTYLHYSLTREVLQLMPANK